MRNRIFGEIHLKPMHEIDRDEFEEMNQAFFAEVSFYCDGGDAYIWEWEDFISNENRKGYMICDNFHNYGFILLDFKEYVLDRGCYIQQFYVSNEHRRQGIGWKAVDCLTEMESNISLHIIRKNEPAYRFWQSVLPEMGFVEQFHKLHLETKSEDQICDFLFWKKEYGNVFNKYTVSEYIPGNSFVAGEEYYKCMSELRWQEHEDFRDAYLDVHGRMVLTQTNKYNGTIFHLILSPDGVVQVHRNRTSIYVTEDKKIINADLLKRAERIRKYCATMKKDI